MFFEFAYRLLWLIFLLSFATLSQEIGCSSAFTESSHTDDHPFPLNVQWGRVTLVVIPVLENWRSIATAALLTPPPSPSPLV